MTDTTNTDRRRPDNRQQAALGPMLGQAAPTARQAETQQTRRRREGLGPERNLKMHVPGHDIDPNWVYRYANDRPGRIHQLTVDDDWEPAPNQRGAAGHEAAIGTGTERVVDKYTGERAILLRKPRKYHEADEAAKEQERKKGDATLRRGPLPSPNGAAEQTYVPGGRNIINGQ